MNIFIGTHWADCIDYIILIYLTSKRIFFVTIQLEIFKAYLISRKPAHTKLMGANICDQHQQYKSIMSILVQYTNIPNIKVPVNYCSVKIFSENMSMKPLVETLVDDRVICVCNIIPIGLIIISSQFNLCVTYLNDF